jgi:hypothetical protein
MPESHDEQIEQVGRRTTCISLALLLISMAFVIARTARDALYIQERGLLDLPLAYIGIALLSMPMAMLMLTMISFAGPRRVRTIAPLVTGVLLMVYQRVAQPGGGPLMTCFFMLIPLVFGVLFSGVWLLGAELFESAPQTPQTVRTRAYGLIGAATITGGVLGSLLARTLALRTTPETLLLLAPILLIGSAFVIALTQYWFPARGFRHPNVPAQNPRLRDVSVLIHQPYTLLLLGVSMLTSLGSVLVEFQFYLAAAASGQGGQEQVSFFATLYFALNVTALFVQLVVMPRLQRRFSIAGSLLILPSALLGGVIVLLGSASLFTRSMLRLTEGGLKSSIHRANWEQTYLPLDRATRLIAKLVIDGVCAHLAEGVGAIILMIWLKSVVGDGSIVGHDIQWMTWLLFVILIAWIFSTRILGHNLTKQVSPSTIMQEAKAEIPLPDS